MTQDKVSHEQRARTIWHRLAGLADVLTTPSCWLQNDPFCREWDDELTELLDAGEQFTDIDNYHATIGGYVVWIENHPYASFTFKLLRPRRATILRAHRRLMLDALGVVTKAERNRRDALAEIACNRSMRGVGGL